jgi:nucleotide-binding universal stress UspA family protein
MEDVMLKDILVHLKVGDDIVDSASDYAVSLAAALDAHLTAVAGSFEIDVPQIYTEAFSTDFIETQRIEARRLAAQAVERFGEAARSLALSVDIETLDGTIGGIAEQVGVLARLYDLTVVSQPDPDRMGSDEIVAEAVLFDSGRALLLVPLNQQKPFSARRILVAWDGSRTAARAVSEARPLLAKAELIEAVIVKTARGKARDLDGADIAEHLSRIGKSVELRRLEAAAGERVVDVLLKEVAARDIDLVVMGGYGHSRLREFVLGGVTRDVLDRMTVPVLMAH